MTPTPEMIEAAARALCKHLNPDGYEISKREVGLVKKKNWLYYRKEAEECLKAALSIFEDRK